LSCVHDLDAVPGHRQLPGGYRRSEVG
jgi:hypothetical protein